MAIRLVVGNPGETFEKEMMERARVKAGWQCPECHGVNVTRQESRFGGVSEDRFSCRECGCQWGRK